MLFLITLISLSVAVCQADQQEMPVMCGATPKIHKCLNMPSVVRPEVAEPCEKFDECEKYTCIFKKSGWIKDNKVDKEKFTAYLDQFAKEKPEWQVAVDHIKDICIATDLPPQGIHVNCPVYDVIICAFTSFVKNAPSSQWSSSSQCAYPRRFAASCPVCPSACFAPSIPIGSCNACLSLPRSP